MAATSDPVTVRWLSRLLFYIKMDVFRRALTGEPAEDLEHLKIKLEPDASMENTKASQVASEKMERLESQMEHAPAWYDSIGTRHARAAC